MTTVSLVFKVAGVSYFAWSWLFWKRDNKKINPVYCYDIQIAKASNVCRKALGIVAGNVKKTFVDGVYAATALKTLPMLIYLKRFYAMKKLK